MKPPLQDGTGGLILIWTLYPGGVILKRWTAKKIARSSILRKGSARTPASWLH